MSLQQAYSLARHHSFTDRVHCEFVFIYDDQSSTPQRQLLNDLLNNVKNLKSRIETLSDFRSLSFSDFTNSGVSLLSLVVGNT